MAVNNALANYRRKKGRAPIPLWKKSVSIDVEQAKEHVKIIERINKNSNWIQKIWAANRRK